MRLINVMTVKRQHWALDPGRVILKPTLSTLSHSQTKEQTFQSRKEMALRYRMASWKNSRPGMDFQLMKERSVSARRMSTCLRQFLQHRRVGIIAPFCK